MAETPAWRVKEQVVALLEQSLAPDARVEHDVQLPERESGKLRQCDVVVTWGKEPRASVGIVEVQDRDEKVGIDTFDSWYRKFQKLGVQHLLCVSRAGYVRDVVHEALRCGPAVRLLLLRDLERPNWPAELMIGEAIFVVYRPIAVPVFSVTQHGDPPPIFDASTKLTGDMKVYEFADGSKHSLFDLMDFGKLARGLPDGVHRLACGTTGLEVWANIGNRRARVDLAWETDVRVTRMRMPITVSSYEQHDRDGSIAWVMTAGGEIDGEHHELHVTFMPDDNDILRPKAYGASGLEVGDRVEVGLPAKLFTPKA